MHTNTSLYGFWLYLEFGLYLVKYAKHFNTCFAVISVDASSYLAVALASVSSGSSSLAAKPLKALSSTAGEEYITDAMAEHRTTTLDTQNWQKQKKKEKWLSVLAATESGDWGRNNETFYTQSSICDGRPHIASGI